MIGFGHRLCQKTRDARVVLQNQNVHRAILLNRVLNLVIINRKACNERNKNQLLKIETKEKLRRILKAVARNTKGRKTRSFALLCSPDLRLVL